MKWILYAALAIVGACSLLWVGTRAGDAGGDESPTTFVFVRIPESIWPVERGEKYEDPLDAALVRAGVGGVTGGGSQLGDPGPDGAPVIAWVGIDVELDDLERGLPLLKSELARLGAPPGTALDYTRNGRNVTDTL
ncbi:hypothetical protein [Luteimonas deserti]|uniref:Uncharacterized protein n=1 Tax=Luteimonas deserti TaxID=2752306 RepID=A0A7Z0QPG8_9GAMM|nr:hypothetical protein [Luteimonas deserti]NYZ61442.1 hypothetical protein [Luteimonas deserti]